MPLKAHALQLYSTLVGGKRPFQPLVPGKVKMYVCGMTVYDRCHIGHGRIFVVFDMIARYLRYLGYDLSYVRNITDVDDKIIARANENGEAIDDLTARCIDAMHEDEIALGCLAPDQEPRATGHMAQIIALIQSLLADDHAYVAGNGDVYFRVASFEKYGALMRQDLESLRVGARVDVVSAKRDPLDFVLWKLAKPGEPHWESPWGGGRPGWHIECSAMSGHCLGEQLDIHGGGLDLRFPHHENEIAQTESVTHKTFAQYWLHAGHVQVNQEKMSKSLGNFFTIEEILKMYSGEVIRYFMLASHYRSPINYSQDHLKNAEEALTRLYQVLREGAALPAVKQKGLDACFAEHEKAFIKAMDDDCNTPEALAVLFEMVRVFHRVKADDPAQAAATCHALKRLASVLGLLGADPVTFLQGALPAEEQRAIEALIAEREQARADKDWTKADQLRDALTTKGIVLEDGADGTVWRRA